MECFLIFPIAAIFFNYFISFFEAANLQLIDEVTKFLQKNICKKIFELFYTFLLPLYYICKMETIRQQKIQTLVLQEISDYVRLKSNSWTPNTLLTITKVKISKDLAVAKVYISIYGETDSQKVLKIIQSHTKEIRYNLGLKVAKQMRIIPELTFFEDDSLDYIENIEKLLKEDK
jgi:ribosome-binding factor A